MKLSRIIIIILILSVSGAFFVWQWQNSRSYNNIEIKTEPELLPKEDPFRVVKLEIIEGSTYGMLMDNASVTPAIYQAIYTAAKNVYDLSKVRQGRTLDLYYDKETDELIKLIYQIDSEEKLLVTRENIIDPEAPTNTNAWIKTWIAERQLIPYEVKQKVAEGIIETSMYEAALDAGIDERAIIGLAEVMQWSVDFAMDVRQGDIFKFIYEERYLDGEYIMPGKILAGKFSNDGTDYYVFNFKNPSEEDDGYYDEKGNSVQKMFLKAPVAYKYISSGYTTGLRYIQEFNISTGHRAIDYAAAAGTPIRTVGDGTVIFVGWDNGYGQKVSVRHNSTYTTNYAHMSKYAVSYGQKVKQGDIIGYVGSTGLSTGPHLHYEMVKNGIKINPLREVLPPGKAIEEENKAEYFVVIEEYKKILD